MFARNAFEYRLGSPSHCQATSATESTVGGSAGDTEEALLAAKLGTLSEARANVLLLPVTLSCSRFPLADTTRATVESITVREFIPRFEKGRSNQHPAERQSTVNVSTANIPQCCGQLKALSELLLCFLTPRVHFASKSSVEKNWTKALLHCFQILKKYFLNS